MLIMPYLYNFIADKRIALKYTPKKIVKETRSTIFVENENGEVEQYRLVENTSKSVSKPEAKQNKKSLLQTMVSQMPECRVILEQLSPEDIAAKIAKIQRDGKIFRIKDKIKSLPRKSI